jgi:Sulfotransferase family
MPTNLNQPKISVNNPVFVVGVFRSGTSLLYSLLNQHPQISLMYECNVWGFPALLKRPRFAGDWLARQEFFNQALSRHRLVWGGSLRGLEKVRTPDDLYRIHGEQKDGATLWGEKSPFYSTRLKQLGRQYPNATFIFIWRHPVETYRSILLAGRTSAFFRKSGMLHRLIYHQEQLINQSIWLAKRDARVRHINYDDLVDRPEQICRSLCEFLEVKFEPAMLELAKADFSAVYDVPHQNHLRKGVIERQKFSEEIVPTAVKQKLERFHKRWQRRFGRPLAAKAAAAAQPEPALPELWRHKTLGFGLHLGSSLKRLGFEFLPLPWLRTYRSFKNWLVAADAETVSFMSETLQNSVTIISNLLLLAGVIFFDYLSGPDVSVGPFYLLPCGFMALIVGLRWGTLTALLSALSITVCREAAKNHFQILLTGVVFWNASMRFVFFQVFVLLLNRIRLEMVRDENRHRQAGLAEGK